MGEPTSTPAARPANNLAHIAEMYAAVCDFIELAIAADMRHDGGAFTPAELAQAHAFADRLRGSRTPHLVTFLARQYADLAVVLWDHTGISPATVLGLLRQAIAGVLDDAEADIRARGVL